MVQAPALSSVEVLMEWLGQYADVPHTYRAYYREFERLQTWFLLEELDFLTADTNDLTRYLDEFAAGLLHPGGDGEREPARRGERTVACTRNALNRMFAALAAAGVRLDNPAVSLPRLHSVAPEKIDVRQTHLAAERWREIRQAWNRLSEPEYGRRDPLWRAIVVAEWSYWTALHRSELASARMSDLRQTVDGWQIVVCRFGQRDAVDVVYVPPPAMDALLRYRISRGLQPAPQLHEADTPLIAKLRSDEAVTPWTIGQILRDAVRLAKIEFMQTAATCELSNRALRRYLIVDGLQNNIPYHDLTTHVRSRYAVDILVSRPTPTLTASLATLEID